MPPEFNGEPELINGDDQLGIRAELEGLWDKAEAAEPAPVVAPVEPAEIGDKPEGDRVRGPDGKFAPKPKDAESDQPLATTPDPDTSKASEAAPSTAPNAPPVSWSADAKAAWATLPPAIQTAVLKREDEASNGFRQKSEEIKRYEQTIAPVAAKARSIGVEPAQYIQNVLAAEDFLSKDFPGAVKWLAEQYGYDLSQLNGNPSGAPSTAQPQVPPEIFNRLNTLERHFEAEQNSKLLTVNETIDKFSKENEHYPAVETDLHTLIPAVRQANPSWGPEQVLKESYDRAVWANPTTRAKLQEAERVKAENVKTEAQKQRTTAAKNASSSVTGSPGTGSPSPGTQLSLRDELTALYDGGGRV